MSYFFSTPVDIDIVLDDGDDRQMVDMKADKGRREKAPLYKDGESVKGAVTIRPKDGKRLEHTGIKVQFIGTIGKSCASHQPDGFNANAPLHRDVLRSRQSLRVSLPWPRISSTRRPATSSSLRLQLQKRREAIRILQRYQRKATIFRSSHSVAKNGGCD